MAEVPPQPRLHPLQPRVLRHFRHQSSLPTAPSQRASSRKSDLDPFMEVTAPGWVFKMDNSTSDSQPILICDALVSCQTAPPGVDCFFAKKRGGLSPRARGLFAQAPMRDHGAAARPCAAHRARPAARLAANLAGGSRRARHRPRRPAPPPASRPTLPPPPAWKPSSLVKT